MGFFDKLFGRSKAVSTGASTQKPSLRAVRGALVASDQGGSVLYNLLTPHMQQFMGKCVGAIKKTGVAAKGTGQFSILVGEHKRDLRLEAFYKPTDDPQLVELVVQAAQKLK